MSTGEDDSDESGGSWKLGPLVGVAPERILTPGKRDLLEEFFLALALVFNDLKTAVLLQETLPGERGDRRVCPEVGQRNGIGSHLARLAAGIVHELLRLISENRAILDDHRFADLLKKIPTDCQRMWAKLVDNALNPRPASSLLCMIRNSAAFHYYQPKALAQGFRAWFFEDGRIPQNEKAYVSVGPDMDATRFYYADAAVQRSLSVLGAKKGVADVDGLILDFVRSTNLALAALIREFISARDPSSGLTPIRRRRK
jgi:hypothetical protein